jgi:hypothetical protein
MQHGKKNRAMPHHRAQPNSSPGNTFHYNVYVHGAAEGVLVQGKDSEGIISRRVMLK